MADRQRCGTCISACQLLLLPLCCRRCVQAAIKHHAGPSLSLQAVLRCSTSRGCCGWTAGRGSRPLPVSQVRGWVGTLHPPPVLGGWRGLVWLAWLHQALQQTLQQLAAPLSAEGQLNVVRSPTHPPFRYAVLVRELRNEVSRLLAAKVANPSLDLSRSKVVEAMHHLLASDGF